MKCLDLNGVSILWRRIKETFARKDETVSDISRNDTTFTVTRADGTTFEFTQKDTTYDVATTAISGLMSAIDKAKLNSIESSAQENIIESVSVNGTAQPISNKGIDITVPTAVSDLADDVGYLTKESDPTVPAWAKQPQKPAYTASEVGALPDDTVIPSKVSELTNDSGYLTQHQDISGKANTADLSAVATSGSYADLTGTPTIPVVPTNVSAFINDADYASEQYVDDAITAALAKDEDMLLRNEIPGTTQVVTFDTNNNPSTITHSISGTTIRTDVFTWGTNSVTEVRTLSTGKYITITTNLTTLEQTISTITEGV